MTALRLIVSGLEHTYRTNGQGGMASALMVLEVAATHYYVKVSVLVLIWGLIGIRFGD